jgi:hypothetical protein
MELLANGVPGEREGRDREREKREGRIAHTGIIPAAGSGTMRRR